MPFGLPEFERDMEGWCGTGECSLTSVADIVACVMKDLAGGQRSVLAVR